MLLNICFIVIYAIIGYVSYKNYFKRIIELKDSISWTRNKLEEIPTDEYDIRLEDINVLMRKNNSIKELWNDFRKTLIIHNDEFGNHKIYSTVNASDIFRFSVLTQDMGNFFGKTLVEYLQE